MKFRIRRYKDISFKFIKISLTVVTIYNSVCLRSHLRADVPTTETSTSGGKFHANLNEGIPQKRRPVSQSELLPICSPTRLLRLSTRKVSFDIALSKKHRYREQRTEISLGE